MTAAGFLTSVEPLFTFEARLPPWELRRMSVRQIRSHLLWWEAQNGPLEFKQTRG